jgi:NADH:ubiquinone oxidoreductase subunit 5 (subunit L)/multisubunit Na+/H+ antiporter MnhA subunit
VRFAGVHRLLENKLYIDEGYQWVVDNVALRSARFVALFDRRAINDGAVNGSGNVVYQVGLRLRYHVTGKLYNYGAAMVLGAVLIVILLWAQPF